MLLSADLPFEEAAERFIQYRTLDAYPGLQSYYVRPNTLAAYRNQRGALDLFFHGMVLSEIHWWHIKSYQQARLAGAQPFMRYRRPQDAHPRRGPKGTMLPAKGKTACPAKPEQVNKETGFLKKLKTLAGCWTAEDEKYHCAIQQPESEAPRALTPDEQFAWLEAAAAQPEPRLVYYYSLLAFDTCASPNELRLLQFGNINLTTRILAVPWPAAKNRGRHREIPLEDPEAIQALIMLMQRACSLGAGDPVLHPTHHLFPARFRKQPYDPTHPMSDSGLKKPWDAVRQLSGLKWFRIEDTRHTAATRLAERGVPVDIITARMGHVRPQMRLHYTHISEAAQRWWLRKPPMSVRPQGIDDFGTNRAWSAFARNKRFSTA